MQILAKKIHNLVLENDNFLIVTHKNPDGDAIGSVLAIKNFLDILGKKSSIFVSTEISKQFDFLKDFYDIKEKELPEENFENIIICDSSDIKHTGLEEGFIKKHKNVINIDHHKSNENFGNYNLILDSASSTTELLFLFFKENDIEINDVLATNLLLGIITDTDNFSNAGTSKNALKISSFLLKKGANFDQIKKNVIRNKTVNKLKSWGFMLSKLEKKVDEKIIYTSITLEEMLKYNIEEESLDGITNMMNNLNDANVAIVLKENKDNSYKISMRSLNENIDVSLIAKKFNGGGHRKAAGFSTSEKDIEEIIRQIISHFPKINK
jgi:phosphoesterase RecJ-like protein